MRSDAPEGKPRLSERRHAIARCDTAEDRRLRCRIRLLRLLVFVTLLYVGVHETDQPIFHLIGELFDELRVQRYAA